MSNEESPKIIVDDDWKTRVRAEREQLRQERNAAAGEVAGSARGEPHPDSTRLPPANWEALVSMFATQTLVALGQLRMAENEPPQVRLPEAKYFIDLLGVLEEKSRGNLTAAEASGLTNTLHQLRMLFVATKDQGGKPVAE